MGEQHAQDAEPASDRDGEALRESPYTSRSNGVWSGRAGVTVQEREVWKAPRVLLPLTMRQVGMRGSVHKHSPYFPFLVTPPSPSLRLCPLLPLLAVPSSIMLDLSPSSPLSSLPTPGCVSQDGFDSNDGVIVVAATNLAETLDPALKRPGRFDRQVRGVEGPPPVALAHQPSLPTPLQLSLPLSHEQVAVPLPDIKGRAEILQ